MRLPAESIRVMDADEEVNFHTLRIRSWYLIAVDIPTVLASNGNSPWLRRSWES